jgi:Tfp pilus assembly protein PilF
LTFAATGIAATIGSTDAQALKPAADARLPFTSLLIRGGAAGVGANVSEPYLRSALRPGILFPAYISGLPLAEAFYRAMPHLSWQSVIFGDPLVRLSGSDPVASPTLAFDETTGLPAHFARRRLDVLKAELRGVPEPAIVQVLAAEDRQLRDDHQGAAEALSKAVDLAPEAVSIRLRLAMLHDEQGETARAIDGYRKVLARAPRHAVALNNLAYRLAADKETIDEALELARRAHAIAPEDANVLDTVGWVHHLAGHTAEAAPLLREAVRRAPQRVAVRIHAATVLVELGQHAEAQVHLDVASKLDPSTNRREDVQQLRARIAR